MRSDVGYKGGVKLQFAIDHQLRRPLTHDLRGLLDVSHTGMPGAAVRGEGQHCHPRRFASDRLPGLGAGNRDIRQLRRRRLRHHAAVGKPQRLAGILRQHQKQRRERFTPRLQADKAQTGAQHAGG